MNILVVTTGYPRFQSDISSIFLKSLYRTMVRNEEEIRVTVVAADHEKVNDDFDRELVGEGLRVKRFRYFFRKWQVLLYEDAMLSNINSFPLVGLLVIPFCFSMFISVWLELSRGHYSLIHAHWSLPSGLVAVILGRLFKLPVMVTSHGGDVYGLRGKVSRFLQKWVFARADLVNAVSIPLKEKIELIEPRARIVVKSMGADENIFRPVDGARECLGINAETKVLLFVGRFSEKKGIPFLLAAMKILEKRFSRIRLLLIGKGNLEEELRAFVVGNGLDEVVDFQGIVRNEELPLYYSAADLLVVPSVAGIGGQEGLPVAIMEGLLCGKKIVTTKVGGIIELSDLKAIFFTEQRDAKSLAETIEQALQDKSVSPEDARREGLRFSGRGIAHSFIGFYSELAMGN